MNWYKLSQRYPKLVINPNEIGVLEEMGFLPQIPSTYKGFYYLLPISQLSQESREVWRQHAELLQETSPNLYNNIASALDQNTDLSIIGLVSGGRETEQHEEVHETMKDTPAAKNLEMLFSKRDPEEVKDITSWLTQHGYKPEEVPGEYYAYILSQPGLLQAEQHRLTEDEFRELRSLGLQVPEEAKRPDAPQGGGFSPAAPMPTM